MLHPAIEPFRSGLLTVADGSRLYWEASGNPHGAPIVWLHGGPGSGLRGGGYRRTANPNDWVIIGLDQRGCGRSRPLATEPAFDRSALTVQAHIADLEELRDHLGIERWLVTGGSWGSTLALAYAQEHPERTTGLMLAAVTTTSRAEVEWITESVERIFPREWQAYSAASKRRPGQRIVDAYLERITDPDPTVRQAAAAAWCAWEDVHVSLDPRHRPYFTTLDADQQELLTTQITHFWANHGFLGEHGILDRIGTITHLPAVLIHGRLDVSGPLVTAWELHQRWPSSRLVVVDEGHGGTATSEAMVRALVELHPG